MKINEIITERSQAARKRQAGGVDADQFFTRPEVASQFASWVKSQPFYAETTRKIEPAAGARALSKHFPGIEEYDLHPQSKGITQADFLSSNHAHQEGTLVVMNPPFGSSSNLAIAFFNKAATFADYIALIGPRTFKRHSVQKQLNPVFELVDQYDLPRGAFYLPAEGDNVRKYDVPAVAQVWKRATEMRDTEQPRQTSTLFTTTRNPQEADFAFRKKGRRAGQIIERDFEDANPNSFFFIKGDVAPFKKVDWLKLGNDGMGARSIALSDIVAAIE